MIHVKESSGRTGNATDLPEAFIRKDQFNFIKEQAGILVSGQATGNDAEVLNVLRHLAHDLLQEEDEHAVPGQEMIGILAGMGLAGIPRLPGQHALRCHRRAEYPVDLVGLTPLAVLPLQRPQPRLRLPDLLVG